MAPHDGASDTVSGLRAWARGVYATEAAVELFVRFQGGRFAQPGHPWLMPDLAEGWYWLEPDHLTGLGPHACRVERSDCWRSSRHSPAAHRSTWATH